MRKSGTADCRAVSRCAASTYRIPLIPKPPSLNRSHEAQQILIIRRKINLGITNKTHLNLAR